ncbi:hypothetical protein C3F09_10015 [candidate division GN15 bacterium]|uniref:Prepilin-type N-terminal cleavage/methylation domain-containing protein n=1 Tax=candidate division GN15 bacterium TaxID=2072418 RepID=A0A855X467_9BACT|nr:MAG: hypothetical protein C3F09_10015 [candidate division GN15 bacterium]
MVSGMKCRLANNRGMSLIELTILLVVIGVLTGVAMKTMTTSVEDARRVKTEREMSMLAKAIVGDPSLVASSRRASFGYIGDIGAFPPNLTALVTNPGYSTWKGPYIPSGFAEDADGYRLDEWGAAYAYSGGLTISSSGHGTPIVKKIADAASDYLLNAYSGVIRDASDSLPGNLQKDSVTIQVIIPDGAGGLHAKTYHPLATGQFQLDSLPVGQHPLNIIYEPQHDTLARAITVLPRQKAGVTDLYKFAVDYFAGGGGGCGGSMTALRPNGAGAMTNLTRSGCSANWQCVAEATADEDASYVERNDNSYATDVYALTNPPSSPCPILSVTVHCRARRTHTQGDIRPAIYIGGAEYDGAAQWLTATYVDYTAQWTTNPATGTGWTWSDVNILQAGMRLRGQGGGHPAYCTQVWVEVRY